MPAPKETAGTAGRAGFSGPGIAEEMQIERGIAREAVKEVMRKEGKTEEEVYGNVSLRLKQLREGAIAQRAKERESERARERESERARERESERARRARRAKRARERERERARK